MSIHGNFLWLTTVASLAARQHCSDSEKTLPLDILIVRYQEEGCLTGLGGMRRIHNEQLLFVYLRDEVMIF